MDYISAGDIEKYSYCPLSWWLSREEKDMDVEGVRKHREIGEKAEELREEKKKIKTFESMIMYYSLAATVVAILGIAFFYTIVLLGKIFISLSIFWIIVALYLLWRSERGTLTWGTGKIKRIMIILAVAATVFSVLAVTFVLPPNYILGYLLEISSLLWLIFASYFLFLALRGEIRYNSLKKELMLPDGEIIYIDDLKEAPLLKSEKYKIWGRPDLLIKAGKDYIPIELKTGRVPRGPLFSHIMQLTAYMLLTEENYGTPPYGLLKYGDVVYRIDYDEDLKALLLKKVEEMRKTLETGEVHRNHKRVGKCLHCSRRDICPERLA